MSRTNPSTPSNPSHISDSENDSENDSQISSDSTTPFNPLSDVPLTWHEAQQAETATYAFESQLFCNMKDASKQEQKMASSSKNERGLSEIAKIRDWNEFIEYRDLLGECLDETRRRMKQLLANNIDAYVQVEEFNRKRIRNQGILRHEAWEILDSSYESLWCNSEKLYTSLIDRLHQEEDTELILSLASGKWKKMLQLRDEVKEALKQRQFTKIVSAYKRAMIYQRQNTSPTLMEQFFNPLQADFDEARSMIFEIICDYAYPFADREQCIRHLRDLDFTNPDPGQYALVAEYKRFQRRVYQSRRDFSAKYFERLIRTGMMILDEHTEIAGPQLTELILQNRRELAHTALRDLCANLVDELMDFIRTCHITLTNPDFMAYKERLAQKAASEFEDFNAIAEDPLTPERHAAILRMHLYAKTFDPTYLTHYDEEEAAHWSLSALPVKLRTTSGPTFGDSEATVVVVLVCAEGTSRISMDVFPRITADEFLAQCQAQFAYENEDISEVEDFVFMTNSSNPSFIFGDRPLYEFSPLYTCFRRVKKPELLMVRASDVLHATETDATTNTTLKYHQAYDFLSVRDMLDSIAHLFEKHCQEFFDQIDDGTSFQPRLFGAMEKVISTTDRFVSLLADRGVSVNTFEKYAQTSRQYAVDTGVKRFQEEIQHLDDEEDWQLLGDHTRLPDLFHEKCSAFIHLVSTIVCTTQEEHVTMQFVSFFRAFTQTLGTMMSQERKNICEVTLVHIAEMPFFKQVLIMIANITYTLNTVYPTLMASFERLFGMRLRQKKAMIKGELNATLQTFRSSYVECMVDKLTVLCKRHLDNLRAFVPMCSTAAAKALEDSQYLPTSSMGIIMRFNVTMLHEFTLIYSNAELIGLDMAPIVNPVIHLVTEYLIQHSDDITRTHMHAQSVLWNHLFVETRQHNENTRRLMSAWMSEFPPRKMHTRYLAACKRLINEHPYFIES